MDAPGRFDILISYGQLKHLHACVLVRHDQHEGRLNVGVVGGEHHAHRTSHPVFLLTALVDLCLPEVSRTTSLEVPLPQHSSSFQIGILRKLERIKSPQKFDIRQPAFM